MRLLEPKITNLLKDLDFLIFANLFFTPILFIMRSLIKSSVNVYMLCTRCSSNCLIETRFYVKCVLFKKFPTLNCGLAIVQSTLQNVRIIPITGNDVQCTMYILQCTMYTVQCTMYATILNLNLEVKGISHLFEHLDQNTNKDSD